MSLPKFRPCLEVQTQPELHHVDVCTGYLALFIGCYHIKLDQATFHVKSDGVTAGPRNFLRSQNSARKKFKRYCLFLTACAESTLASPPGQVNS